MAWVPAVQKILPIILSPKKVLVYMSTNQAQYALMRRVVRLAARRRSGSAAAATAAHEEERLLFRTVQLYVQIIFSRVWGQNHVRNERYSSYPTYVPLFRGKGKG